MTSYNPHDIADRYCGKCHTWHLDDGTVIKSQQFQLMPPAPHLCQQCAVDHRPHEPHNVRSFFYQTKFNMEHGRAPTWTDAIAHCDEAIRRHWIEALTALGEKL